MDDCKRIALRFPREGTHSLWKKWEVMIGWWERFSNFIDKSIECGSVYGMVYGIWYGIAWCGMIWYGMVYDMVYCLVGYGIL